MIETLKQVQPDATLLLAQASRRDVENGMLKWRSAGLTALFVRGRKMRTTQALFDEVAAALQFPYYFGESWNAFHECLSEIDWLPFGDGLVLIVEDADAVLADEAADDELNVLVRSFALAFETYGRPIDQGAWFDRPPVPFHVVLQVEPAAAPRTRARWTAAGARLGEAELETGG